MTWSNVRVVNTRLLHHAQHIPLRGEPISETFETRVRLLQAGAAQLRDSVEMFYDDGTGTSDGSARSVCEFANPHSRSDDELA